MTAVDAPPAIEEELRKAQELSESGRVQRPRHIFRWLFAIALLVFLVQVVSGAITNPAFRWDVVGEYLFNEHILDGLLVTLKLTVICMVIGIVLGIGIALMRMSSNPVLTTLASGYLWLIRGVPTLVQLLFWYFLGAVLPEIGIGIPWGPVFASAETNQVVNQMSAAILGLGLGEAAYMAEIVRGGILSVGRGQSAAAQALGMSRAQTLRRIVLPQAFVVIVPPTGNQVIGMLKWTAAVFVIGLPDLLTSSQMIYGQNFQQIPLLIVVCFWYLLCVSILMLLQRRLERHYGRGYGEVKLPRGKRVRHATSL
ncbi:amino acid ABC transporter permease [Streptosporangium sp. NPDC051022]|uniref:amino acid ABC transporter permease n=1 Tax=Streptosporangium sp. NPDC051022 TaxID=3155752 RepID=UPI003431FE54